MTPQSNYEQARDEAAEKNASNLYDAQGDIMQQMPWSDCKESFQKGSDFGLSYEQKLNADLLADNKLMREALVRLKEIREIEIEDTETGGVPHQFERIAATALSKLKGKYDE